MLVVDVSAHNGAIDWTKAYADGVRGAIIRLGYGSDKQRYDDPFFRANVDGAISAGIKVGAYLYSYAKTLDGAKSEAYHAIRVLGPYKDKLSLPVFFDSEEKGTERIAKSAAKIFCEVLETNGYKAGVYASDSWFKSYLGGDELRKYVQWVAKWSDPEPKGYTNMQLWQYSAYGTVSGIGRGSVDMDKPYGEILEILSGKDPKPVGGKVMVELSVLRKGYKGGDNDSEVFTVQSILKAKGYKGENGKVLALDNSFGGNTEYAVKSFQKANGLTADGIVGAKTWDKLLKG